MHQNAVGLAREEIVKQVPEQESSIHDYQSYVPVGNAVQKIRAWKDQGAVICYLTSRKKPDEIEAIKQVLDKHNFSKGQLFFRQNNEECADVVERVMPDVLIEDDCESIGGVEEMYITHVKPEIKNKVRSISIKEFGSIDHLSEDISFFSNN